MSRLTNIFIGCIMAHSGLKALDKTLKIEVQSSDFKQGQEIPRHFTCQGSSVSPQLSWTALPEAVSYALIVEDPDAPAKFLKPEDRQAFTHWVVFNVPAGIHSLAQDEQIKEVKAREGLNSAGEQKYTGPCPPSGAHRYFFRIYALDTVLDLKAGASKDQLLKAMQRHIIGQGELMGLYKE